MLRNVLLAFAAAGLASGAQAAPQPSGRDRLLGYLDARAKVDLEARAAQVAALKTPAEAAQRQAQVRTKFLTLIGGLPPAGPLAAKTYATVQEPGFRLETVTYDSTPGYHVTADVFVPEGKGPFPAVIVAPGHGPDGKSGDYVWGANLAKAGILALSYDVVGEGERWQHFDPETGESKAGRPTGQHSVDYWSVLPAGGHVASYFVADAVRGIDYLVSRKDVDPQRIGAFGCSGGGTVTAYLAAVDPRVKATAVACYVNDYAHLLAGPGNQDAEQTVPWFLEQGLDIPDLVEAAAPRPYAIVSTTEDMFPFAGAKAAHEEASRIWSLYGASDRLQWIVGPGRHGALQPIAPDIVAFFTHWLKDDPAKRPFTPDAPARPEDVLVTPTGQLATSLGGETIWSLNRKRAEALPKRAEPHSSGELAALQARLAVEIRSVTRAEVTPGGPPPATTQISEEVRNGCRLQALKLAVEPGFDADAVYAANGVLGRRPALLLMSDAPPPAQMEAVCALVDRGWRVLALAPRGAGGTEEIKSPLLGDWNLLAARAMLVGKTPVGMRTDDAIRAVDWLAARPDVDPARISVYGFGALGPVALHAAVLDRRIAAVYTDGAVTAYREAVDRPLAKNMPEVTPPGVLQHYDLEDLVTAIAPRPVTLIDPVDGLGQPLREAEFNQAYARALASARALRESGRVQWRPRWRRDNAPMVGAP